MLPHHEKLLAHAPELHVPEEKKEAEESQIQPPTEVEQTIEVEVVEVSTNTLENTHLTIETISSVGSFTSIIMTPLIFWSIANRK